jgi:hypothetical protein
MFEQHMIQHYNGMCITVLSGTTQQLHTNSTYIWTTMTTAVVYYNSGSQRYTRSSDDAVLSVW